MTSVLDLIVKLPRFVKVLSTNGKDENNAVVLDDKKERRRLNARNHYKRHRDSIIAKQKIYHEKNKERIREYRRKFWLANKQRLLLKQRERYQRKRKKKNDIQMS